MRFRSVHARIRLLVWVLTGALLCTLGRAAYLQIALAPKFATLARRQHELYLTLPPLRGTIYDRQHRPLAMTVWADSVAADPRHMDHAAKVTVTEALTRTLHLEAAFVQERLGRDKAFVWIKRQLANDEALRLRALELPWVYLVKEPKRLYPAGTLASHVMGYVGVDHNGLEGIEAHYDPFIAGERGFQRIYRDGRGRVLYHHVLAYEPPRDGYELTLTIDAVIQAIAEEALDAAYRRWKAQGGSVIVLDPRTGAVLALANRPTFDANAPADLAPDVRRNRAVTDLMEPGSVFKAVVAGALLEAQRVTPDDRFFCEQGEWWTVGRRILHDVKPHGWLTFREVVAMSSNIGMVKAAQRLEPPQLYHAIRRFGFGSPTAIDLPGEVAGIVHPPSQWSRLSPFAIPIGQEVGVTAMQVAVAMSAIANGGLVLQPHVVQAITTREGTRIETRGTRFSGRALSTEVAAQLRELLIGVIERGSGKAAKVRDFLAGGKTGTSQKIETDGRYSHRKFIASFAGFVPAEDPALVIVVTLDEPRPLYYGGVVAAPVFRQIAEAALQYLGASPIKAPSEPQFVKRPTS